jgi:hypothetical protein
LVSAAHVEAGRQALPRGGAAGLKAATTILKHVILCATPDHDCEIVAMQAMSVKTDGRT